jgi:small nuclear ribonucleoprotein (snRNP)-like protein
MAIFVRTAGKILEISGKILQADGVNEYLENKGKELLEHWVQKKGIEYLSIEQQKQQVVEAIGKPLQSRPFAQEIDTTFGEFLEVAGNVCKIIQVAGGLPAAAMTMLVPIAFVQDYALSLVERRIRAWAEFQRLYDGDVLREAFLEEWRTAAKQKIREANPATDSPFKLSRGCWLVLSDYTLFWSQEIPQGSFYIYCNSGDAVAAAEHSRITLQIKNIDRIRGRLKAVELNSNVQFFEAVRKEIEGKQTDGAVEWDRVRKFVSIIQLKFKMTLFNAA